MKKYQISDLSVHLFWDVDISNLSFEKSAQYLIERVAYLGDLSDWLIIRSVYDERRIKQVILNMRYLDERSLHFYALVFDVPKESFRCYKLRQSGKIPLPF